MALTLVVYESSRMLTYAHVCSRMLTYAHVWQVGARHGDDLSGLREPPGAHSSSLATRILGLKLRVYEALSY